MVRIPETHDRRELYLKYAAAAEAEAFRSRDVRVKDAYANIAKSWSSLAHELDDEDAIHLDR